MIKKKTYLSIKGILVLLVCYFSVNCINSQSIESVDIKSREGILYAFDTLKSDIVNIDPASSKIIYDWQYSEVGSDELKSLKIIDIPFDADKKDFEGRVYNYASNVHGDIFGATYSSNAGHNNRGAYTFLSKQEISIADSSFLDISNGITVSVWIKQDSYTKFESVKEIIEEEIVVSSSKNLNAQIISSGRSYADGIAYRVIAPNAGDVEITNFRSADNLTNGLDLGDEILIINLQGQLSDFNDVGNFEYRTIVDITEDVITVNIPLMRSYTGVTASDQKVVVQRVPKYKNITLNSGGTITASSWDGLATFPSGIAGYRTGIISFKVKNKLIINSGGYISATGLGLRGGGGSASGYCKYAYNGEGINQPSRSYLGAQNVGGGEGGDNEGSWCSGVANHGGKSGGGGSYQKAQDYSSYSSSGRPGEEYGEPSLRKIYLGSGGGGGSSYRHNSGSGYGRAGGNAGGIIIVDADTIINNGTIRCNGNNGYSGVTHGSGGGGGSGGSILLSCNLFTNNSVISSEGGSGGWSYSGGYGAKGGSGRIRINYTESDTQLDYSKWYCRNNSAIIEKPGSFSIRLTESDLKCFINDRSVDVSNNLSGWNNIVLAYDNSIQELYVNGQHKGEKLIDEAINDYNNSIFMGGLSFNGTIDDFQIWRRSLSATQLKFNYEHGDSLILPDEIRSGENWKLCATPNDNINAGTKECSDTVYISPIKFSSSILNNNKSIAFNSDNLVLETDILRKDKVDIVYDWQYSADGGNSYESLKLLDMIFNGRYTAENNTKVKDYIKGNNGIEINGNATPFYTNNGGKNSTGAYTFDGLKSIKLNNAIDLSGKTVVLDINEGSGWKTVAHTSDFTYQDGVLQAVEIPFNGEDIGIYNDGSGFNGKIDNLKVYNRKFTQEQLKLLSTNNEEKLLSDNTIFNEVWRVKLTPNDNIEDGITDSTNTVLISVNADKGFSLRFIYDNNNSLSYTPDKEGKGKGNKWTWSGWVKRGNLNRDIGLFSTQDSSSEYEYFYLTKDGSLRYKVKYPSGEKKLESITGYMSGVSDWYHVLVVSDKENPVAENRIRMFVDGNEITTFGNDDRSQITPFTAGQPFGCGNDKTFIGANKKYNDTNMDGYLAEITFVDGEVLMPHNFRVYKYDKWSPVLYNGEKGENGIYLNFSNQLNPGLDASGNNHKITVYGFDSRKDNGKYIDQVLDHPSRNFNVLDFSNKGKDVTKVSEGNLYASTTGRTSGYKMMISTTQKFTTEDIFYFEQDIISWKDPRYYFGFIPESYNSQVPNYAGLTANISGKLFTAIIDARFFNNTTIYFDGTNNTTAGSVIAWNINKGEIRAAKNNVLYNSGNPVFPSFSQNMYVVFGPQSGDAGNGVSDLQQVRYNFGQGGCSGLNDYTQENNGTWRLSQASEIPDARFKYKPPDGYEIKADKIIIAPGKRRVIITIFDY